MTNALLLEQHHRDVSSSNLVAKLFKFMASNHHELTYRDEIWVTVLIVLASIGFVIAFGLWIFTLYKIITLDLKTRNLWLSQVILLFIFLSYGTCFIFVPTPNLATCAAIRFLPGFCYAGLFSGLILKCLNIITESRHIYVPGYYQAALYTALILIQLAIGAEWLILHPPQLYNTGSEDGLLCTTTLEEIIVSFVYAMLLVFVLCIVTSVARRWTIIHREEAFLLSVSVGFIIPIWLAWTLLGTIGSRRQSYEDPCLAFGLLATTSLILILVFLPRARKLSKLSRTMHHVTFGDAQYAVPNKLMTINTNPSTIPNGNLSRDNLNQSSMSLPSVSQFSPPSSGVAVGQNLRSSNNVTRMTNRSAVSGNMRPDSRIYLTPSIAGQRSFYTQPVYLARDHMWSPEDGTHL